MPPDCLPSCPLAADHKRMILALCGDLEGRQPGVLHVLARHGEQLAALAVGQQQTIAALGKLCEHNARQSDRVNRLTAEADGRARARKAIYRWGVGLVAVLCTAATLAALPSALRWAARVVERVAQSPPGP